MNDDGAGRQHSVVRFDAIAGEEYRIAVSGYGVAHGEVQLTIATNGAPTLFGPILAGAANFEFRALSEPGRTNFAQRSISFSNWTSFDSKVANDWWIDFRDPLPATNSIQVYRVTQP